MGNSMIPGPKPDPSGLVIKVAETNRPGNLEVLLVILKIEMVN